VTGTQRGQATIEMLAGVPLLILGALVALQLCAVAYTMHLADGAAEAGALAVAAGEPGADAARESLPTWARSDVAVSTTAGRVSVSVRPPAPLAPIAEALRVRSSAWALPAPADG
jgi:hypothetical protein